MNLPHPIDQGGFQEALISVRDLDESASPFLTVGGWKQWGEDSDGADLAAFWSAPSGRIRQRVLHNPASTRGFIRLVRFDGVEQRRIRSNAMPWETGGLCDLYLTVRDAGFANEALRRHGWQGFSDPITYSFAGASVSEIIMRSPEGVVLCLMEMADKANDPYLVSSFFGGAFNVALTVAERDYAASCAFFRDVLGWNTYFEGVNKSQPPGDNPTGLPRNLALSLGRRAGIFVNHPSDRTGSLLVLAFEGLEARDHATHSAPPNLGLFGVRVAVTDPDAIAADIIRRGGTVQATAICDIDPYGRSKIFAVVTPTNARIEFFGPAVE
jgi:catechol 2,3-dioxygenase-like lactoylglutathione lyase family enzyme